MTTKKKELIVTSALPYANGPLHFGHLLEHIQTDIWVRSQRILGNSCIYLCASDSHGTPIMMKADEENISPEKLVDKYMKEHKKTLKLFQVNHDCYYQTHSEENKKYSELIYKNALNNGYISKKKIKQLFDEEKNLFLADRYVQGGCPKCNEPNQYGDNCDVCGAKYEATELKNPISIFSKKTPIIKESEHIFFNLKDLEQEIKTWIDESSLQESVNNKLQEWFKDGLMDWDISRDAPYFGFKIPGYEDKFFYVWLDAPIGYIGTLEKFLKDTNSNDSAKDLWDKNYSCDLAKELKELGVEESLINLKGMTQGMLVILGQKNIKKLNDFADLSSDELIGGFDELKGKKIRIDGYLEEFSLSRKEADDLIMSAREIAYN